eukprot:g4974.t2
MNIHRSTEMYNQLENGTGVMVDCGGDPENKIDRYDGRALLDIIPRAKGGTAPMESTEMQKLISFETYRDLVRLKSLGLNENDALLLAENENIEIRAAVKANATQSVHSHSEVKPQSLNLPLSISSSAAATYGTSAVLLDEFLNTDCYINYNSIGCRSSFSESGRKLGPNQRLLDRDSLDKIGYQEFGISDYCNKLKRLLKVEGDHDAFHELQSARSQGNQKKKYTDHDRHRGLQGGFPHQSSYHSSRDLSKRSGALTRGGGGVHGQPEFITEFTTDAHEIEEGQIEFPSPWDAMESATIAIETDPAFEMHDPSRLGFEQRTQARKRKLEEERRQEELKSEEAARKLLDSRKEAKLKAQGYDPKKKKETPQERLKRFTAAQLEKQAKKDAMQSRQKQIQNEKDQQARIKIERSGLNLGIKSNTK